MKKTLPALLGIVLSFFVAEAHAYGWRDDRSALTVKIYSCFGEEGNEDSCLEGSGILTRGYDRFYIFTSEHVVLPSNTLAHHRIVDRDGNVAKAEFVKSSWEVGVAVLSSTLTKNWINRGGENTPYITELAPSASDPGPDVEKGERVWASGFAAGSGQAQEQNGNIQSIGETGELLSGTEVVTVSGLRAEFGMSGGPVHREGFGEMAIGLMTHVTFEPNPKTFVIPIRMIARWWEGRYSFDHFTRTFEDFQREYFSDSNTQVVSQDHTRSKIEVRQGKCLVTAKADLWTDFDLHYARGLQKILSEMLARNIRIAEVQQIDGVKCKGLSLSRFVGLLRRENRDVSVTIVDFEGVTNGDDRSLVQVENFKAKKDQFAFYEIEETYWASVRQTDAAMSKIWWEKKKVTDRGFYEVTNGYDDISEWSWRADQQRYMGRNKRTFSVQPMTTEKWRQRLASCEQDGGTIEIIQVPRGKFRTCAIVKGDYKTWYGPVPVYGIVQKQSLDGSWTMRLKEMQTAGGTEWR